MHTFPAGINENDNYLIKLGWCRVPLCFTWPTLNRRSGSMMFLSILFAAYYVYDVAFKFYNHSALPLLYVDVVSVAPCQFCMLSFPSSVANPTQS